jgi:hypothetical protein
MTHPGVGPLTAPAFVLISIAWKRLKGLQLAYGSTKYDCIHHKNRVADLSELHAISANRRELEYLLRSEQWSGFFVRQPTKRCQDQHYRSPGRHIKFIGAEHNYESGLNHWQ